MSTRITSFLGMDITAFRHGLDKASVLATKFRQTMAQAGGGQIGALVGVAALIRGLAAVITSAQEARDKAHKIGGAMSASTLAVATFGDSLSFAVGKAKELATYLIALPLRGINAFSSAIGLHSPLEDTDAMNRAEKSQKENAEQLKKTDARLTREIAAAEKELTDATKARRAAQNDTSDKSKLRRLHEEMGSLFKKMAEMPASVVRTKVMTELEKLTTESIALSRRILAEARSSGFGVTLSEAAKGTGKGGRSERERIAASAVERLDRGRRAEASGNMKLAAELKSQGESIASGAGFGETSGPSIEIRRGTGSRNMDKGEPWDARFGGQLSERNNALTAKYGFQYKRADSFENAKTAEASADALLNEAAAALKAAAEELKTVEVVIDAN